jgi:hypothetical protein
MKKQKQEFSESKQTLLMLAYLCLSSDRDAPLVRKVEILDRFGMNDKDIASVCECGEQSVRDARQKIKKAKGRK